MCDDNPINKTANKIVYARDLLVEAEKVFNALHEESKRRGYVEARYKYDTGDMVHSDKIKTHELDEMAGKLNHMMLSISRFTPTGT